MPTPSQHVIVATGGEHRRAPPPAGAHDHRAGPSGEGIPPFRRASCAVCGTFGIGIGSKVAVGAIACALPMIIGVTTAVLELNPVLAKVGRSFGISAGGR